jgi:mRNA interferase YafQ
MNSIRQTKTFKKDVFRMKKRGKNLEKLQELVSVLAKGLEPDRIHKAHPLRGNWIGYMDAHIEPDWILIYKIKDSNLLLARTGTHSDLF